MKAISGGGSSPRFSSRVGLAVFIFACILFTSQSAVAQTSPDVEQGIKPYGAYHGGDFDSVSLATGRLDLHIPFLAYPQRGGKLKLSYTIRYQNVGPTINELCLPMHPCTYYATDGGLGPQALLDQFITAGTVVPVIGGKQLPAYWVLSEPDGSVHDLVNTSGSIWESIDATGIRFDASSGSGVITNSSGTRYTYQWNPPEPELIEDANGNQMSINPTSNSTDTLGRTLPPYMINGPTTTDYSGCTGPLTVVSAQTWAMPSLQGGTETYKFCFANVSYNVSLTYEGITRSASGTFQQMQSIVLPNGTAWTFQYETTYGSLASITMPTGGSIAYTWVLSQPCGPGGFPVHFAVQVASRTVNANDGTGPHTWNYSWTNPVKITDPLENDSLHTITGLGGSCSLYETEAQYFQGSSTNGTLLKTVATDYLYAPNADISTPPLEMNVVPIHITTTWAANNKVSRIEKDYDSGFAFVRGTIHSTTSAIYGDVVAEREYDYGTGTWGSLLRQTLTSYLAFNNSPYLSYNLLKIPSSVQVNDGGGTQRAYTTYSYDGSGLSSSGITTQHDANPANGLTRGNQTSTSKWLNTTGGYLTSSSVYFDTGTVNTSTDPKSNVTTFAYSATYAGGYPTTVTNALHQSTTNVYDLNTGLLTSTTDPNGQIISSVYEPTTWRKTQVNFPDLGQANFCYSDVPTSSCYNAVSPFFVVVTQKLSSATLTETAYVDGLGRVTQTQLNSDPSGTIYTLTTYDADGRKSTVTNPYRSTSDATYGITTFQYDALGRPTLVIPPDGTTTTNNVPTQYCGGTSTMVIDQAGRWRRTTADALGRLLEVDEPNSPTASVNVCPGTSEPIWATTYTYDTLNDLASVSQGGSRNRSFVFDSLKRMTSSTNPETGTVNYTYDSDGNVLTKADARSITITYGYDALNRMTGRTYSNSDSAVTYTYDQAATGFFNIGRRTGMTDAGGSETWSYDSMGRELAEQRITDSITKTSSYTYNLDGSLATMTYPSGRKITYGYDAAARPISAIDTANSINYATSGTYAPPGGLSALTLGAAGSFTGISLSDTYNKRLQPNELKASSTAGTAMDLTYSFVDANSHDNGNAIQVTNNKDTTRTQQFS
jgi:YD repeat-containing protein